MHFIRSLNPFHQRRRLHHHHQRRRLYDAVASLKCVRDRGLDHAVERDKNLKPLMNVKNLIKAEPSKSLPLNIITQAKESLQMPTRPIEFIRNYPSIFQEFLPGGIGISPHIKLTPLVLDLDKEEEIMYQSVDYKQDAATRLLKLLMISRTNKIPLDIIDRLKWDLGLAQDYVETIVPEFPDYFRVINGGKGEFLELVCWNSELAVSVIQKWGIEPIEFPLIQSSGFEMDKKYQKWVDEWQKLPYISPYEDAKHLVSKSDESDKWAVGILHEILSLFVANKAERDNVLVLGECLGLRSRFKLALLQHPMIFYVSNKIGTHTVVLKDGYKRGMLIERHIVRELRHKYIKLMSVGKEEHSTKSEHQKTDKVLKEDHQNDDGEDEMKNDEAENSNDKDNKRFQKVNGRSKGRLPKRDRHEREGPQNRELRRPSKMRSSKNEVPRRDRLEGEVSQNRELRRSSKMRSSKNEVPRRDRLEGEVSQNRELRRPSQMRSSKNEVPRRDRLEGEVSQNRELRRPSQMRSSKNEVPRRDRLEGEESQNRELRRPSKMRSSKNEGNSIRRPRLKTETIASKNFYGQPLPDRKGKKQERL